MALSEMSSFVIVILSVSIFCVTANTSTTCSLVTKLCNIHRNVSTDTLRQINTTLSSIATLSVKKECLEAVQNLLCLHAFPNCNSNLTQIQQRCQVVQDNCSELVAKTYASTLCSSISSYNSTTCVGINVAADEYCPNSETYKIQAKDVTTFLAKAGQEETQMSSSGACVKTYRIIHCKSFVPNCLTQSNTMSKERCLNDLSCLSSNSTLNKTALCSKFQTEQPSASTSVPVTKVSTKSPNDILSPTTTAIPTTLSLANTTKTTVTFKLENTEYIQDYNNKTSPSYIMLTNNLTTALNDAYTGLPGFVVVQIVEYSNCGDMVIVKHDILTRSQQSDVDVEIVKAMLKIASTGGFLKNKVASVNEGCKEGEAGKKHGHDENNWVYMIVFVCATALLLLIMVLCNQSS